MIFFFRFQSHLERELVRVFLAVKRVERDGARRLADELHVVAAISTMMSNVVHVDSDVERALEINPFVPLGCDPPTSRSLAKKKKKKKKSFLKNSFFFFFFFFF
jgi:hypothetical protein